MSSRKVANNVPSNAGRPSGGAEQAFRDAFDRLKRNKPERLPTHTPVSQNMVAKEAGCDPSALKKSRYPSLIAEIQQWLKGHDHVKAPSSRQSMLARRRRNRSLKKKIAAFKCERDHAVTLLVEADAKILDLTMEMAHLQESVAAKNVTPIRPMPAP